ncbi:MAG: Maf family protein [Pseudomonadota bacterium]
MTDPLLLGSSSPYRRELLARLGLPFTQASPSIDETPREGEGAAALVERLAREKAAALAPNHRGHWVLASDQAAALGDAILGKPGNRAAAIEQLRRCSGRLVVFHTAVCLVRGEAQHRARDETHVRFRELTDAEIERYVDHEEPFDCAGSFKAEGLGVALFESLQSVDPTAIVGLPLITVARLLREAGYRVP